MRELTSPRVEKVLDEEDGAALLTAMAAPDWRRPTLRGDTMVARSGWRAPGLPLNLARRLTPGYGSPVPLSPARLGLRASIASKTVALLEEDAALLVSTAG